MSIIRRLKSLFVAISLLFTSFIPGLFAKKPEIPEAVKGEYTEWVDPFIGTGSKWPWASAMLSPCATYPFGAVRLGPDTSFPGGFYIFKTNTSGYYYQQKHILGFSHTRLSGTGCEDLGNFRVTPASGSTNPSERKSNPLVYSHSDESAAPGYYAVYLRSIDCLAEMTATSHVGVHRYTFGSSADSRLFLDVTSFIGDGSADNGKVTVNEASSVIEGQCVSKTNFSSRYGGLTVYFSAVFDTPFKSFSTWNGDDNAEGRAATEGDDIGVDINFGNISGKPVELKIGISFVSVENARENLLAQAGNLDFDAVCASTGSVWNDYLSRAKIESTSNEIKTNYYTALYHSMIMPTDFTDENGEYIGFDGKVSVADGYTYRTDMSLWDTFRTEHPLLILIAPEIQLDCVKSLVEMAKAGGALPRWPSGAGYTGSMLGTPADMVIAETYLKGITAFDAETALSYMKKGSEQEISGADSRIGIAAYNKYGYCPYDIVSNKTVARTLEYSWADYSISQLAQALGKEDDAQHYAAKSRYYKNVFDPETKYFRGRYSDGTWVKEFNPSITTFYDEVLPVKYASAYCEGSARQWRWCVPQEPQELIKLFGSNEYFVSELEDFMEDASLNRAALDPGDGYWHGNQPDMHAAYLFNDAGRPELTQKWVRWILTDRYASTPDGLDGNDDGGTVSAWYILSAVGIYPVAGTDRYWIGAPIVDKATLDLGSGKTLTVIAENQSENNIYVQSVTLNGRRLTSTTLLHSQIANGGTLVFNMGSSPAANGGF